MKELALIFLLFLNIAKAVSLVGYNVYERPERIDVLLSFDEPFNGSIYQRKENDTTSLILNSLNFGEIINRQLNSKLASELIIEPIKNATMIGLKSKEQISAIASKSADGFSLRIRITSQALAGGADGAASSGDTAQSLESEPLISWRYFAVLAILLLLLLALFVIKKFISGKPLSRLVGRANFLDKLELKRGVETIYERPLDAQNRVVLLEYNSRQYLVLVGSTNVLLDRFGADIKSEDEFSTFFEENKRRISAMIEKGGAKNSGRLSNYKDKIDTLA